MTFHRVEFVLELCREHLDKTGTRNTPIDSILAAYACAVIYAAFEQRIGHLILERATVETEDPETHSFARVTVKRLIRSITVSELAGLASHFSSGCKERFRKKCTANGNAAWDAIVSNRHGLAHEDEDEGEHAQLSTLTFADVERNFGDAVAVLAAFESALAPPAT